jgi:hypothetical protein
MQTITITNFYSTGYLLATLVGEFKSKEGKNFQYHTLLSWICEAGT